MHRVPDEVILLQSTGLKDKNGKEIFEGDILQEDENKSSTFEGKKIFVVKAGHVECCIGFIVKSIHKYPYNSHKFLSHIQTDCKIIGNVYENPELLKEKA